MNNFDLNKLIYLSAKTQKHKCVVKLQGYCCFNHHRSLRALSLSLCVLQGLMSHNLTENLLLGMLKWN